MFLFHFVSLRFFFVAFSSWSLRVSSPPIAVNWKYCICVRACVRFSVCTRPYCCYIYCLIFRIRFVKECQTICRSFFFMLAAVTLWCIAEWHLTFWWIRSISVWPLDMLMFVYMLGHVDNATDGSPWRGFVSLPTQKYVNDKSLTRRRVHSQCVGGTDCEFKMAKWQRLRLEYIILIMARVISKYKIGCI